MRVELPSGTPASLVLVEGADRGLVVVPDIWGLRPLFDDMCVELADRTGWSVVAVEPFPGQQLPGAHEPDALERRGVALRGLDDAALLGDLVAAADRTGAERAGVIGFCMGGMYALKAAGTGRFDKVASFYGMVKVPERWNGPGQGQPLDALAARSGCEVMSIIGTADALTPPDEVAELEAAGAQVVRYDGADHGFVHDPSRPTHRPDDAADAWRRVLAFLSD